MNHCNALFSIKTFYNQQIFIEMIHVTQIGSGKFRDIRTESDPFSEPGPDKTKIPLKEIGAFVMAQPTADVSCINGHEVIRAT